MPKDIEQAERMGRARAGLMALAAVILLLNAMLQFGNPNYSRS